MRGSRPPPRSICIVLLTGLGDVVMGLGVANALKRHEPSVHITWIAEPMPAGVLRHHAAVDEVVIYHKSRGLAGVRALRRELAERRFDLTLNLNVYFKSIWPALLSGAPHRLGFGRDRARDGVWLAANHHLPPRARRHTQDMFMEFLEEMGIPSRAVEWGLAPVEEERMAQEHFFAPLGDRPVVAVVPASSSPKKDWIAARYAEVVDALEHDFGFRAVLVGGPGEREGRLAAEIRDRTRVKPAWGMGDGVRRLVWLLDGSALTIAPDTGPVHISRALGVPVIGLYGHTNPWRVGPYGAYHDLWVDRYTEEGRAADPSDARPRYGRMEQITVRDVLERVERAVARYLPHRARPGAPV